MRKYTDEVLNDFKRRYDAGESLAGLARERGIKTQSLRDAFKYHGIKLRSFQEAIAMRELHGRNRGRRKYTPEFIVDIERRRARGECLANIAQAVAIKPDTLRSAMRYHGIRLG